MLIAEAVIQTTVQDGLMALGQDPQALAELYQNLTPQDQSRIQQVLAATPPRYQVILGFPTSETKDTTIGITLGAGDETEQALGSGAYDDLATIGGGIGQMWATTASQVLQTTYRLTIYSSNSDLSIYLSYAVLYVLWKSRQALQQAGLIEQRLSMGDFEPTPQYLPTVMYVRAVMLSAKTRLFVTQSGPYNPVTESEIAMASAISNGLSTLWVEED